MSKPQKISTNFLWNVVRVSSHFCCKEFLLYYNKTKSCTFFFKISHIKKKLKLTCWIIFYNGWISAHHFLFSLLNIWTLQRWLIFIVLIFSSWIMLYTLSIHWHNLINITNLILFAVACWFTDCQCRALHAIFLNNAHFFIQFFNLFQFRTYLLACTLIIHSRATEIVLNIYLLNITAISIVWEVFLRFVSLKFLWLVQK